MEIEVDNYLKTICMDKLDIAQYFDYTLPFYKSFWHKDSNYPALHYGFWEQETKNLKEALLNTNQFLAEKAKIEPDNIILDAGCGIGGSAIWIARNFGAHVIGVTLS